MLDEYVNNPDSYIPFFVLTESHLKARHLDAEISCENYSIVRADRPQIMKGGVAIYIHNDLAIDNTYIYADTICQAAAVYNSTHNLLIVGIYRPPTRNLPTEEQSFSACLKKLQEVIKVHEGADIQIYGDLNFPFIEWETREIDHSRRISEQNSAKNLLEFMQKNLLLQLVTETTRHDKSTLDLLLTNNDHAIHNVFTEKTNLSDHDFVHCALLYKMKNSHQNVPNDTVKSELDNLNLNKADFNSIRTDLSSIQWSHILQKENASVEDMFSSFEETITKICASHAPQHRVTSGKKKKIIPKCRRSLHRTRRHVNYEINKCKYFKMTNYEAKIERLMKKKEKLELQIRDSIKREMEQKEIELISKIKTNPKAFYTFAKKNAKTYSSVGPLADQDKKLHSDPTTMCNMLQQQYQKAFSDPKSGTKKPPQDKDAKGPTLEDITFTEEDIISAINDIPVNSAPGPDKITSKLLKECKKEIAPALLIIWRTSLDTGQIPDILKKQSIIPIHKKDSKAIPANYRPVSLTSHITKLFERILRKHIVAYIENNHIIHNSQHGFRPGRSCLTQLLHHVDSILYILEANQNADVIYLDLSKAFDKVNHAILLHKLELSGISGKLLTWIKNFLTNRTQHVVIDGATSSTAKVLSGVPQGTVLGPVLFIIYMNDLHRVIKNSLLKCFADDSKLIKSIQNLEDREKLIQDLKEVLKWTEDNSMKFNADKFQLLQHGRNNGLKIPYDLPDQKLEHSQTVRDLGTNVSEDLKWKKHVNTLTNQATSTASWVLRTIKCREVEAMLTMYRSFVMSRLEYNSPVWNPARIGDIIKVEAVQRSFTAKIKGMDNLDYWQRLSSLRLYSLQRRRERYIIIHSWKI